MGKPKAANIPVPYSGAIKHKKRLRGKVDGCSNTSSNQFKVIDLLFEEVEAILRSPSITALPSPDTISHRKIPDLFKKRQQMPKMFVEVDLHPPPAIQTLISLPTKSPASCVKCCGNTPLPHTSLLCPSDPRRPQLASTASIRFSDRHRVTPLLRSTGPHKPEKHTSRS
ncbi:hypothetical protein NDU88_001667 [Pleurodeles waltl]|uniref:Uncharacterized protein n=1 Tax=Pleurodeles waltl TaxID=8319 RepID=A0AAV7LDG8_PLEWA|nr:hypothetical protein NDU88_001667 [Pleurodeles waltl]